MVRQPVKSSNLASIGYDVRNEIQEIEFKIVRIYKHFNFPENVYDRLINASSHSEYFDKNIKNAGYRCEEI